MTDLFGGAPEPAPPKRPPPTAVATPAPEAAAPAARGAAVQLHDGRTVDSWSEDWRLETLARWVLAMPFEQRGAWIHSLPSPAAQAELKQRIYAIRQAAKAGQVSAGGN